MDPYIPVVQPSSEIILVDGAIKTPYVAVNQGFVVGSHPATRLMTVEEQRTEDEFQQFLQWRHQQQEFQEWKRCQEEQRQHEEQLRIPQDPQYQQFLLWQQEQRQKKGISSQSQQIQQQQEPETESQFVPANPSTAATTELNTGSVKFGGAVPNTTNSTSSPVDSSETATGSGGVCFNPVTAIITFMTSATATMNNITTTQKNANKSFQSMQQAFGGLITVLQNARAIAGGCTK
jgi:hypothetical protein